MARIVRPEEHAAKRNEILDAAQRIMATRGFEQMTIGKLLTELDMSKGAFYHYFGSKGELLEAMIVRMRGEAETILTPILEDPSLTALEKMQRWFDAIARWKTVRKAYLMSLLRVWYDDDNALVRHKLRVETLAWLTPLLRRVVQQGIEEHVFSTSYPDHVPHVLYSLLFDMGDALAGLLLSTQPDGVDRDQVRATLAVYTDALERALGAPPHSLVLVDSGTLEEWFG